MRAFRSSRLARLLAVLALVPLLALSFACHSGKQKQAGPAGCVNFDTKVAGMAYTVGGTFTDSGVGATLGAFQWSNGTWTSAGSARIDSGSKAGGSGLSLNTNNINVKFDFGRIGGLTLKFGEYGGNLNLRVNGEFRNFGNFAQINGQSVGGVTVAVTNGNGNDTGTLTLSGVIEVFEIGGQELWIDDLCPSPAP